jgi:hypothetical protein
MPNADCDSEAAVGTPELGDDRSGLAGMAAAFGREGSLIKSAATATNQKRACAREGDRRDRR